MGRQKTDDRGQLVGWVSLRSTILRACESFQSDAGVSQADMLPHGRSRFCEIA
jgi:hypothetical protein